MWECGLKHQLKTPRAWKKEVTPYVGVWIETNVAVIASYASTVTPYVGVWIETRIIYQLSGTSTVTPYVGVWIET